MSYPETPGEMFDAGLDFPAQPCGILEPAATPEALGGQKQFGEATQQAAATLLGNVLVASAVLYVAAQAGLDMAKFTRKKAEEMEKEVRRRVREEGLDQATAAQALIEIDENTDKDTPDGHQVGEQISGDPYDSTR